MKAILKEKYRYILFKCISEKKYETEEFQQLLANEFINLVGEIGFSRIMPKVVFFDGEFGITRILREGVDEARVALALITKLGESRAHLQSIFTSGTLRKCKSKLKI